MQKKRWITTIINSCLLNVILLTNAQAKVDQVKNTSGFFPFFVTNNLPISIGLGLPKTLSAHSLQVGEKRLDINYGVKSNANDAGNENSEILILDGETKSIDLGLSYGLTERWQVDAQLSYISHSGGNLDGLIQNWHDFFSLDDGDRPFFGRDEFLYSYTSNGEQSRLAEPSDGISDIRIGLAYAVKQNTVDNLMLRAGISLPTGDAEKLTGSEKTDVDLGIYANGRGDKRWKNLGWHANVGYLFIGDDTALGITTKSGSWFNSFGAYWGVNSKFTIKGQLDSHGVLFESNISELNKSATELTLGFAYQTKRLGLFELYFSEDITVNRAADFSIGLSSRLRF